MKLWKRKKRKLKELQPAEHFYHSDTNVGLKKKKEPRRLITLSSSSILCTRLLIKESSLLYILIFSYFHRVSVPTFRGSSARPQSVKQTARRLSNHG